MLIFLEALRHDKSRKVALAVRDLLNKMKSRRDDMLAIACMQRLVGRGFDADLRRSIERPMKRSPNDAAEIRRMLSSLKKA